MERISDAVLDRIKEAVQGHWAAYFVARNTVMRGSSGGPQAPELFSGYGAIRKTSADYIRIDIPQPKRAILRPTFWLEFLVHPLTKLAFSVDRAICRMFFDADNKIQVRQHREEAWSWLNRIETCVWLHCPEQMGEIHSTLLLPYDVYADLRACMIERFGLYEPTLGEEESARVFLSFQGMNIFRTQAMALEDGIGWDGPGLAYTTTAMLSNLRPLAEEEMPDELSELPQSVIHLENDSLVLQVFFLEDGLPDQLTVFLGVAQDITVFHPRQLVPVSWFGRKE